MNLAGEGRLRSRVENELHPKHLTRADGASGTE